MGSQTLLGGEGGLAVDALLFTIFLSTGGAIQTVVNQLMDSFVSTGSGLRYCMPC